MTVGENPSSLTYDIIDINTLNTEASFNLVFPRNMQPLMGEKYTGWYLIATGISSDYHVFRDNPIDNTTFKTIFSHITTIPKYFIYWADVNTANIKRINISTPIPNGSTMLTTQWSDISNNEPLYLYGAEFKDNVMSPYRGYWAYLNSIMLDHEASFNLIVDISQTVTISSEVITSLTLDSTTYDVGESTNTQTSEPSTSIGTKSNTKVGSISTGLHANITANLDTSSPFIYSISAPLISKAYFDIQGLHTKTLADASGSNYEFIVTNFHNSNIFIDISSIEYNSSPGLPEASWNYFTEHELGSLFVNSRQYMQANPSKSVQFNNGHWSKQWTQIDTTNHGSSNSFENASNGDLMKSSTATTVGKSLNTGDATTYSKNSGSINMFVDGTDYNTSVGQPLRATLGLRITFRAGMKINGGQYRYGGITLLNSNSTCQTVYDFNGNTFDSLAAEALISQDASKSFSNSHSA